MLDFTAIRDVVAIDRDAEQGFRGASNAAQTPALKAMFTQLSVERGEYADELLRVAQSMNLDIPNPTGLSGMMRGGWTELRGMLGNHDERDVLAEALRTAKACLEGYQKALQMSLNEAVREVLQRQAAHVQQSHDRIVRLQNGTGHDQVETVTRQA
jgi:uncharacterized protein (TIGR02284 family)